MSLKDLELRAHSKPIEAELNKQKEKNGALKKEILTLRRQLRENTDALKIFPAAYPGNEWKMMLHEEGCTGTRNMPNERYAEEGMVCNCDGDYSAECIEKAIANSEKLVPPKKGVTPIKEEATPDDLLASVHAVEKMK